MGRVTDINAIAEHLLKQYRDIPSLDKSQKLLIDKYGNARFADIRKRFAQLWLDRNGVAVKEDKTQKKVKTKVGRMTVSYLSETPQKKSKPNVKAASKKRTAMFPGRIVPVPEIMRDTKGRKVVTKWLDSGDNIPPIHLSLQVRRTMVIGGRPCHVVEYGPDGVEPYEWHLPIADRYTLNKNEIQCIFYKSSLMIDSRIKLPVVYKPGNVYAFLVLSIRQIKEEYQIECYDQNGCIHKVCSDMYINVGSMIRCKVKNSKAFTGDDIPFNLSIVKDNAEKKSYSHKEPRRYKSRKDADERSGYVHFVLTPMGNKR